MEAKEIDKIIQDKSISEKMRKDLIKKRDILTNNKTVKK